VYHSRPLVNLRETITRTGNETSLIKKSSFKEETGFKTKMSQEYAKTEKEGRSFLTLLFLTDDYDALDSLGSSSPTTFHFAIITSPVLCTPVVLFLHKSLTPPLLILLESFMTHALQESHDHESKEKILEPEKN
jgi:hypothetical protein